MARHEREITAGDGKPLDMDELLALLGRKSLSRAAAAEVARACYLSSSEGWREAVKQLGGAFASDVAQLTEAKEE